MIFNSTRYDIGLSEGSLNIFYNNDNCWAGYEITSVDHGPEVEVEFDLPGDKISIGARGEGDVEILIRGRHKATLSNCENPNPENLEYTLKLKVVIPDSAPFIIMGECGSTPRVSENALVQLYATPIKDGEVLKKLLNWDGYPNFSVTQDAPFQKEDLTGDTFYRLGEDYGRSGVVLRNLKRGDLRFETKYGDVIELLVTPVSDLHDFELIPYFTSRGSYLFVGDQIHGGSLPIAIAKPVFADKHCNNAAAPMLKSLTPDVCSIKTSAPFFVTLLDEEPIRELASIPDYIDFEGGQIGECKVTAQSGDQVIQTFSFENIERYER